MDNAFDFLTLDFFTRASVFPGSLGTFRYRFQRTGWVGDGHIQACLYEIVCFELAKDVETETFPWTGEGVSALKDWLGQKLTERGTEPYRIPYPPVKAD